MGEGQILSGEGPQLRKKYGTSPTQPRSRVQALGSIHATCMEGGPVRDKRRGCASAINVEVGLRDVSDWCCDSVPKRGDIRRSVLHLDYVTFVCVLRTPSTS
jgi:hypothetical protein